MNAALLVDRELRAESRRPANFWLRVLAAATAIFVFASVTTASVLDGELGLALFNALDRVLTLTFWIVVPLMTADCVSREMREGTLGLLFLTPLTFFDVLLGKSITHSLRALSLFLAVLPVLVLPFLLGGVTWLTVSDALMDQSTALLLGLASGLFASSRGGTATQAMVRAVLCAGFSGLITSIPVAFFDAVRNSGWSPSPWSGASPPAPSLVSSLILLAARGMLLFLVATLLLGWSLRRLKTNWQREAQGQSQPEWVRIFAYSRFWLRAFRWDTGRARERNPMSWLQEYSWTARLTKWGWFLAMLIAQIVFVPWMLEGQGNGWQPHLTCALTLGAAFSAAGSFRRERETGLLEALLVTPLTPLQIVAGRLWGIFCHYLPALLALVGFWGAELWLTRRTPNEWSLLWPDPMGFVAVMILGVYLSLFRLSFFFAWLTTWLVGFVFSALVCLPLVRLLPEIPHSSELCPFVLRLCLAAGVWCLLMRKVHSRGFVETPRKPAEA